MTRGRLVLVSGVVLIGAIIGFARWSNKKSPTVEVPPVGNNLETSNFAQSLQSLPLSSNPDAVIENDSGRVEIRVAKDGEITSYQITAQVPVLDEGYYGVWVENKDMGDLVNLGKLSQEKGGWLLTFQTKGNVSGYTTLIITRELRDDSKPELVLFRGPLPEGR